MVSILVTGITGNHSIELTQDPISGEFKFQLPNTAGLSYEISANSYNVNISIEDLLNDEWKASENIESYQPVLKIVNDISEIDITINPMSLFEAHALSIAFSTGRNRNLRVDLFTLVFDMYRHRLLLNNLPLIEQHGYILNPTTNAIHNAVSTHAQTYWNNQAFYRGREVIDVSGGDDQSGTGIGFCKLPTVSNGMITFCLTTPPSRSRLRSDHLQYSNIKACLLYTSPSPRDS